MEQKFNSMLTLLTKFILLLLTSPSFGEEFSRPLSTILDDPAHSSLSPAARLEAYLFSNYSTISRPVLDNSKPVDVNFDLILNQVLKVVSHRSDMFFHAILLFIRINIDPFHMFPVWHKVWNETKLIVYQGKPLNVSTAV